MEGGSLSTPEFKKFASSSVVPFLHVTTRIEGREGDGMLGDVGGRGFPTLVFLDAEGEVVHTQGDRSISAFQAAADALITVGKAKSGEKVPAVDLLLAEIALEKVSYEDAMMRRSKMDLKGDEAKKLDAILAGLEVDDLLGSIQGPDDIAKVGPKLVALDKAGKAPTDDSQRSIMFWYHTMTFGMESKDIEVAKHGFAHLERISKTVPRIKRAVEQSRTEIEDLEKSMKKEG